MTGRLPFPPTWARRSDRSIGWAYGSSDSCFYCEERIDDFRCVKFETPSSSISLHEGECWDLFVVGVAIFNNRIVDQEVLTTN